MSLTRPRRPHDEHGQVVVVFALFLVVLMLFMAVVFDAGAVYLERRQDVTAADAGALAGASGLLSGANKDVIGQKAVEVARRNLRPVPTIAAWNTLFAECSDEERDMTVYPAGNDYKPKLLEAAPARYTECVHFNDSFTKIRVRIPDQILSTSFSRIVGINTMRTNAVAEAQVFLTGKGINVAFAIEAGHGSPSDLLCVRLDGDCSRHNSQTSRILDSPLTGNARPEYRTPVACGHMFTNASGEGNGTPASDLPGIGDRAAQNTAVGLDHTVLIAPLASSGFPVTPGRNDDCGPKLPTPRVPTTQPNWIYAHDFDNLYNDPSTRAAARAHIRGVGDGLAFGGTYSDGGPPRLMRFPAGWNDPSNWPTRTLRKSGVDHVVDDRPLWDYIPYGALGNPASCDRASFDVFNPSDTQNSGPTNEHMSKCLSDWVGLGGSTPLFTAQNYVLIDPDIPDTAFDIMFSPRWGVFPEVGEPGDTNFPPAPVLGFEVGFIQSMFMSDGDACPDPPATACIEFNPGDDPTDAVIDVGTRNHVGMTLFWLQKAMLPEDAQAGSGQWGTVELIH